MPFPPAGRLLILLLSLGLLLAAPANGGGLKAPPYTPLWAPSALQPDAALDPDRERWEGELDQWMARSVENPDAFQAWVHTVTLQLSLDRPRSALRALERARSTRRWDPQQRAQLDWLEAAVWVAQEEHELDILEGEECLRRAERALARVPSHGDWVPRVRYASAWLACAWGRAQPAALLLEEEPELPPEEAVRLYEGMLRASSHGGLAAWSAHFETALAENDTLRVRAAARIGPESYLRWLLENMSTEIEAGLATGEGGGAIEFWRVEQTIRWVAREDESLYRGLRRRMETTRALDPATGSEVLDLMRALRAFDAIFADTGIEFAGRLRKAIAWAEGKVERSRRLQLWYEVCRWNWGLAYAHGALGNRAAAIQASAEALAAARTLGDPYYRSVCAHNYFSELADQGFASRRLQVLPDIVEEADQHGIRVAVALSAQGRVLDNLGDRERARELLSRAYREARRTGDFYVQMKVLDYLCFMSAESRDTEGTNALAKMGIERLQLADPSAWPASYRAKFDEIRSWLLLYAVWARPPHSLARDHALARLDGRGEGHFPGNQDILLSITRAEGALLRGELEQAGTLLRSARQQADSLGYPSEVWRADALEARRQALMGEPQAAARFYESSLAGLEAAGALLSDHEQQAEFLLPARRVYDEYIELLASELDNAEDAYVIDERGRARALRAQVAEAEAGAVRSLAEVQSSLLPSQLLLQYRVGEGTTRLWVVRRDGLRCLLLPAGRESLGLAIRDWRAEIDSGLESAHAQELGELLLGSVRAELARSEALVLIADAPISSAPFALLRLDGRRLVETHASSWEVSGSVRLALRTRGGGGGQGPLVIAAYDGRVRPDYLRLPVLPAVEREADLLASLDEHATVLRGEEASFPALARAVSGARFVHLAAHAGLDPFGEPFVLLAPSAGRPGLVQRQHLASLPLSGVELVTLATCESSRLGSRDIHGDLSGLGAAVFAGGARGLIASLWKVEDHSTLEFMRVFYEELLAAGYPTAHALRSTQQKLSRAAGALERDWGAFCAYGP